jgi:hypothetical protein
MKCRLSFRLRSTTGFQMNYCRSLSVAEVSEYEVPVVVSTSLNDRFSNELLPVTERSRSAFRLRSTTELCRSLSVAEVPHYHITTLAHFQIISFSNFQIAPLYNCIIESLYNCIIESLYICIINHCIFV